MDVDSCFSSPTDAPVDLMAMMMEMEKLNNQPLLPSGYSPPLSRTASTTPHVTAAPPSSAFSGQNHGRAKLCYGGGGGGPSSSVATMKEMIFRIAAMQPVHIDPESVKPPKRRNVKISKDPQSVAARQRRERISERIRILQQLVPGGTRMDTASMLDEAIHYMKFLKSQVQTLERAAAGTNRTNNISAGTATAAAGLSAGGAVGDGEAVLRASALMDGRRLRVNLL